MLELVLALFLVFAATAEAAGPRTSAVEWREGGRTVVAWPAPDELAVFSDGLGSPAGASGQPGGPGASSAPAGPGGQDDKGETSGSALPDKPTVRELAARLGATVLADREVFALLRLPGPRFSGDLDEDRRAVAAIQDELGRTVSPVLYDSPEPSPAGRLLLTGELVAVFGSAEEARNAEVFLEKRGLRLDRALDYLPGGRIYRAANVVDAPLAARELLVQGLASSAWPLVLRPRFVRE